jgi:hypothetical protein
VIENVRVELFEDVRVVRLGVAPFTERVVAAAPSELSDLLTGSADELVISGPAELVGSHTTE